MGRRVARRREKKWLPEKLTPSRGKISLFYTSRGTKNEKETTSDSRRGWKGANHAADNSSGDCSTYARETMAKDE